MRVSKDEELGQIKSQLLITSIIDTPGAILMVLGLYGVFGTGGNTFLDILKNQNIAYGAIAVGGAIMAWALVRMVLLLKRRAEILNAENA
jgi:hypothetical protein